MLVMNVTHGLFSATTPGVLRQKYTTGNPCGPILASEIVSVVDSTSIRSTFASLSSAKILRSEGL